jgi:hypothetical protein
MPQKTIYLEKRTLETLNVIHNEKIESTGDSSISFSSIISDMVDLGIRLYEHNKNNKDSGSEFDDEKCLKQILGYVIALKLIAQDEKDPEFIKDALKQAGDGVKSMFNNK